MSEGPTTVSRDINWREIELACVAGMSYKEAEEKFGIKEGTVRKRALRYNWPTPARIATRTKELALKGGGGEGIIETVAATLMARGEKHREHVFTKASESVKKSKVKPPRNWKDFEIADKVARRAAGLDVGENIQQTLIQINESAEPDVMPVDATVLTAETVEVDSPP